MAKVPVKRLWERDEDSFYLHLTSSKSWPIRTRSTFLPAAICLEPDNSHANTKAIPKNPAQRPPNTHKSIPPETQFTQFHPNFKIPLKNPDHLCYT